MSGSFGGLAAIVSATFKLAPLPPDSSTVVATFGEIASMARAAAAIASSQLEPVAFDVQFAFQPVPSARRPLRLLIRFASTADVVKSQVADAAGVLAADDLDVVSGTAESGMWRDHRDRVWKETGGAVIKASWMPAALGELAAMLEEIGRASGAALALAGRAGVGTGVIRLDTDPAAAVAAIERLRTTSLVGNVAVLRADARVKARIDVWGSPPDTSTLLGAVKRSFDPAGILNAGRGPI